jgi:hypothetical protein
MYICPQLFACQPLADTKSAAFRVGNSRQQFHRTIWAKNDPGERRTPSPLRTLRHGPGFSFFNRGMCDSLRLGRFGAENFLATACRRARENPKVSPGPAHRGRRRTAATFLRRPYALGIANPFYSCRRAGLFLVGRGVRQQSWSPRTGVAGPTGVVAVSAAMRVTARRGRYLGPGQAARPSTTACSTGFRRFRRGTSPLR